MKRLLLYLRQNLITRQFMFFVMVGIINVINGVLFAYIFSLFLQVNIAFICGYAVSLMVSYILNSFFVFFRPLHWCYLWRFTFSYMPNFILQNLFVLLIYNLLNQPKILAYSVAAILSVPITFLALKFFAFRQGEEISRYRKF
ncbi:MAG: GtrA family protein [Clostridia bacterium]|nr:GtrA family protein [Peptococcus niger]MDU7505389.1 GtrA family protein [Clostridia bacterium]